MSNPTLDSLTVLPPEARVNWRSDVMRHACMCLDAAPGQDRWVTCCTRLAGHTGRHATILLWDGTVREVWE